MLRSVIARRTSIGVARNQWPRSRRSRKRSCSAAATASALGRVAHRVLGSERKRHRRSDLQVPQPPPGIGGDPELEQAQRRGEDVDIGVNPEKFYFPPAAARGGAPSGAGATAEAEYSAQPCALCRDDQLKGAQKTAVDEREWPGRVDPARFTRRPLAQTDRFAFWRRWLVDEPRGWDMSGRPGSVVYDEQDLAPFQSGAPVLLYVGRFTAVKRLPLLIAAHARVNERLGTPAPLVLVGGHPGEWEGEHPLAAAARLGNQHVFLAGWRAQELLPQALNAADLLVLPSVGEAFGLVLVEAMACGLPVVACASHGPAAIVADGKTGWLVPPDGVSALSDALLAAASDHEERRARGERAYAESRRYAWPAIARRLASVYEELLAPAQEYAARAGR